MPYGESLKKTLKITETTDSKGSRRETNITVPFCRPQSIDDDNASGNMPTFWRGFWPWAGGERKQWDKTAEEWKSMDELKAKVDFYTTKYRPCNTWEKTPQCSILSIIDKIQQHPSNAVKQLRADWQRETFVNPLSSGKTFKFIFSSENRNRYKKLFLGTL